MLNYFLFESFFQMLSRSYDNIILFKNWKCHFLNLELFRILNNSKIYIFPSEEIFIQIFLCNSKNNFKINLLTYRSCWKHYACKLSKNLKPKTCPSHFSYYHRIIFDRERERERKELRGIILFTRYVRAVIVYVLSLLLFFSSSSSSSFFFFFSTMPQLVTFLGNFSSPISKLVRSGPSLSTFVVDDHPRRHTEISTLNYLDNRFVRLFFFSFPPTIAVYDQQERRKLSENIYQEIIFCRTYIPPEWP